MTHKWRNEGEFTSALRTALKQIPGVIAWRRSVGRRGYIKFGITGESDLQGVVAPHGRMFAIELKVPGGERSPEQVEWAKQVQDLDVAYLCTDNYDEAIAFVRFVANGERARR